MFRVPERTSIEPRNDTNHMALCLESGTYEEVKEYLATGASCGPARRRPLHLLRLPRRPSFAALVSWREWVGKLIQRDLNQRQSEIYIDTRLGSAANTVIPANAGIQGTLQNVLSWTPACAGVTKDFAPSGCSNQPTADCRSSLWGLA